jgi:hypothetical protein
MLDYIFMHESYFYAMSDYSTGNILALCRSCSLVLLFLAITDVFLYGGIMKVGSELCVCGFHSWGILRFEVFNKD